MEIQLPYGTTQLTAKLPDQLAVDFIDPPAVKAAADPMQVVIAALNNLLGEVDLTALRQARSVAIAVNDKTRPVPHQHLLPPLLDFLRTQGIPDEAITFYIAVGTHPPMWDDEFDLILPEEILARFRVISHDSEDERLLVYLGDTPNGTPVWTNAAFHYSDFKIVVGNIEPHQFMGFSGGVKSAAVGLAGIKTINTNHALMANPASKLGRYADNPARQDIEAVGALIHVHLALNAVLNQNKKIVHVFAGDPVAVMQAGIPHSRRICQVEVAAPYDIVIASVGGHPKDINVYQAQKGLFHATQIISPGGTLILAAACPEGAGSPHYEDWMAGKTSNQAVFEAFSAEGFQIGVHKAFQIARDAAKVNLKFYSEMPAANANKLLLNPVDDLQAAIDQALAGFQPGQRVGVLPHAASTIPYVRGDS